MSGHSKWSQIKRQKGVADAKRGQVFTKLGNAITLATKEGASADPASNFKLRLAIDQAKSANMPKENIQRAIDRGLGKAGAGDLQEVMYEGYGPAGVALFIATATDNRNRTTSEIKSLIERNGGNLAGPGSVAWIFNDQGEISVAKDEKSFDQLFEIAVEAGAEDVEDTDQTAIIYTKAQDLETVKENLIQRGLVVQNTELSKKPANVQSISDPETAKKILNLLEKLENLDDVQKVYANFDIPDDLLKE